jgi:enamine deaminase RidA (YjgF/YER057c/UK114 family)
MPYAVPPFAAALCVGDAARVKSAAGSPTGWPAVRAQGDQLYVGGLTVPVGGLTVPVGGLTVPVGGLTLPVGGLTVPVGGLTVTTGAAAGSGAAAQAAEEAAAQTHQLLASLAELLRSHGSDPVDVVFVHLYLRDMAHFRAVNAAYEEYFGSHPPSRSAVQARVLRQPAAGTAAVTGSAGTIATSPLVALDCIAFRGSGRAVREFGSGVTAAGAYRSTLHVASLSAWAPLCIGPYCQANTTGPLVWLAGQIGLRPDSMALAQGGLQPQLAQALVNTARLLAALSSALPLALSVTVYLPDAVFEPPLADTTDGGGTTDADIITAVRRAVVDWVLGVAAQSGRAARRPRVRSRGPANSADERGFSLGPAAHQLPSYVAQHRELRRDAWDMDDSDGHGSNDDRGDAASESGRSDEHSGADEYGLADADDVKSQHVAIARRLMARLAPVYIVRVPALPRGALVEIEVVAVTAAAAAQMPSGLRAEGHEGQDATEAAAGAGSAAAMVVCSRHSAHGFPRSMCSAWAVAAADAADAHPTCAGAGVPANSAVEAVAAQLALRLAHALASMHVLWDCAMHVRVYFYAPPPGAAGEDDPDADVAAAGEHLQRALCLELAAHGASPLPAITLVACSGPVDNMDVNTIAHAQGHPATNAAHAERATDIVPTPPQRASKPQPLLSASAHLLAYDLARLRSEVAVRCQYPAPDAGEA